MDPNASTSQKVAVSRHVEMAEAFQLLANGLSGFIDKQMRIYMGAESWEEIASEKLGRPTEHGTDDPYFQLLVLNRFWGPVFAGHYGEDLRPIIKELIETRNRWAHFSLPDEIESLDRSVIIMERLLAPVDADAAVEVRSVRFRLKHPKKKPETSPDQIDFEALTSQLDETKLFFENLKKENLELADELTRSKQAAANKQLRLATVENQLSLIHGKSEALESYLTEERSRQDRIQWLFIGFITVLVLVVVVGFN